MPPKQSPKPLKIFFHAVEGIGHLNGCIGLGQALAKRGHKIYFLMGEEFRGKLSPYGFEEIMLHKPEPPKAKPIAQTNGDALETEVPENNVHKNNGFENNVTEEINIPEKPKNLLKEFSEILLKSGIL